MTKPCCGFAQSVPVRPSESHPGSGRGSSPLVTGPGLHFQVLARQIAPGQRTTEISGIVSEERGRLVVYFSFV